MAMSVSEGDRRIEVMEWRSDEEARDRKLADSRGISS